MGPILLKKLLILMKNHKIINKNIEIVNLEILKIKTWFGDKDCFSSICLVKPMILQKLIKIINKNILFYKHYKFINKKHIIL